MHCKSFDVVHQKHNHKSQRSFEKAEVSASIDQTEHKSMSETTLVKVWPIQYGQCLKSNDFVGYLPTEP